MKTVYIAGPMRGHRHYNHAAFDEAAQKIAMRGDIPISPAEMDRLCGLDVFALPADHDWDRVPDGFDFNACMWRCIRAVLESDGIYMLDGWARSAGARAEYALARWAGKRVEFHAAERQP